MVKSEVQTHTSIRHHNGCNQIVTKERLRYERKGYGLIFAFLIFFSFFIGVPYVSNLFWSDFMRLKEEYQISYTCLYLGVNMFLHNLIHLGANLVYWVFYHFEFSFIERYKSNPDPWPWHEDPVKWRSLVMKSVAVLLFNGNILVLLVYLPLT